MISEYIIEKVKANLIAETADNHLGFLWWLLEPVMIIGAFYFVFGILLQRGGPGFIYDLMVGVVCWIWFSNCVTSSMLSIKSAGGIINQIHVFKMVFPLIEVLVATSKQSIVFTLLLLLLVFVREPNSYSYWLVFPIVIAVQFLLILAVSFFLAAIVPFIPDLRFIIRQALRLAMFCSGVFYSLDRIPVQYHQNFLLNPMANLIHQYRAVLLHESGLNLQALLMISLFSVVVIILSFTIYRKYDRLYPRLVV